MSVENAEARVISEVIIFKSTDMDVVINKNYCIYIYVL